MENRNQEQSKPQQQAAENSPGNPFENGKPVDQEVQLAQEELDKEQQFKEAQTERD